MTARLAIGLLGALPRDAVVDLARATEAAGFDAFWLNDGPGDDSLGKLAAVAEATSLRLGVGVIPLDRMPAPDIAGRVRELGLPLDRLRIGVGAGASREGSVVRVRDGVAHLRDELGAPVVVGALGPRIRELAARESDGIVFNWLTPDTARAAMADLRSAAAGRDAEGVLYVRTIVESGAREKLAKEASRYARVPAYAANFDRHGIDPLDTTLDFSEPVAAVRRFTAFRDTVDELVFRVVTPANDPGELLAAIPAVAAAIR